MNMETGSDNIRRASPEWRVKWLQALAEAPEDMHPLHYAYQLVNQEVVEGTAWAKCPNCGTPYAIAEAMERGGGASLCSTECADQYLEHVYGSTPF